MHYFFELDEQRDFPFSVVSFLGKERLNSCYSFDITLASKEKRLDAARVIGEKARFAIQPAQAPEVLYHGLVGSFEQLQEQGEYAFYAATLVPQLWLTTLSRGSNILLEKDIKQRIRAILQHTQLDSNSYDLKLSASYPVKDYICQYNESDFEFLLRSIEHYGIHFHFEQTPMGEKVIFTDSNISHTPLPEHPSQSQFLFHAPSGMNHSQALDTIQFFSCKKDHGPARVRLKDYNYAKPDLDLNISTVVPGSDGPETEYLFGEHYFGQSDGKRLLKLRAEEVLSRRERFHAVSNSPYFRPGYTFSLKGHFQLQYDQDYMTLEVRHKGRSMRAPWSDRPNAGHELQVPYQSQVVAVPSAVEYRPSRKVKSPRMFGLLSAKIDASGSGQYAELDEEGRYKIKLPFDLEERMDGSNSSPVRMIQAYAGSSHGMHFPLHKGAEILLSHIDGHPDRPIIVAAAPNPDNPSLVTENNVSGNLFTSSGQNKMHMEDQDSGQSIYLESPTMSTNFRLGASGETGSGVEGITMETQGNDTVNVNQSEITQIGGTFNSTVSGNRNKTVMKNNTATVHGNADQGFQSTYTLTALDKVTRNFNAGRQFYSPNRTRTVNNALYNHTTIQVVSSVSQETAVKDLYSTNFSIGLVGVASAEATGAAASVNLVTIKYTGFSLGLVGAAASVTGIGINIHNSKIAVLGYEYNITAFIKFGKYKKKLGITALKLSGAVWKKESDGSITKLGAVKVEANVEKSSVNASKHDN